RAFHVTGVQTCALPIYPAARDRLAGGAGDGGIVELVDLARPGPGGPVHYLAHREAHDVDAKDPGLADVGDAVLGVAAILLGVGRSEERRVGNEWRVGWL